MKIKRRLPGIFLRGLAMGAADVVPGVSGGTIAFITGIYEELLATISGLRIGLLKVWKNEGFKAFWEKGNFSFLVSLLAGIAVSIISFAKLISWLLNDYPVLVWSFFFGLVLASIWLVGKTIPKWNLGNVLGILSGTALAWWITISTPVAGSENLGYIFLCGCLAICAMILPGISGSFILVLLGAYLTILSSLTEAMSALKAGETNQFLSHALLIVVFMAGCLVGLLSFSRALSWLFKKAHALTIAILTGFLIGSLNKIWPWKQVLETAVIKNKVVPVSERNVLPGTYQELTGSSADFWLCILLASIGLALILILEKAGKRQAK